MPRNVKIEAALEALTQKFHQQKKTKAGNNATHPQLHVALEADSSSRRSRGGAGEAQQHRQRRSSSRRSQGSPGLWSNYFISRDWRICELGLTRLQHDFVSPVGTASLSVDHRDLSTVKFRFPAETRSINYVWHLREFLFFLFYFGSEIRIGKKKNAYCDWLSL